MANRLSDILARGFAGASPASDVIWKNTDLEGLEFIGVIPSSELLQELLTFKSAGDAGITLARLAPGRDHAKTCAGYPSATVRLGAVQNRSITEADLVTLSNDTDPSVAAAAAAEIADRQTLRDRVAQGESEAAVEMLTKGRIEEIERLHDNDPAVLSAAVASVPGSFGRITALDPSLADLIGIEMFSNSECIIPSEVAAWACGESVAAEGALASALMHKQTLRRRLTTGAQQILTNQGHLSATGRAPVKEIHVNLEDMAAVLETFEIAGMYFSTNAKISDDLRDRILTEAPVSLVVNHLIGQTPRHPQRGEVMAMIKASDTARRTELSEALNAAFLKFDTTQDAVNPFEGLPWAGELLLGLQRTHSGVLNAQAATELIETIQEVIGCDEQAWEFLLALSEEWEGALMDLVESAANMEGIPVETTA